MAEKALVLSADAWEMADERTGEMRKGVSFWYISDYREDDVKSIGFKPTKLSGSFEAFDQVRVSGLPGVYEMNFASRPGKDNKATLTLVGVKHVKGVDLFAKASAQKVAA